jgi:hypothetical protein
VREEKGKIIDDKKGKESRETSAKIIRKENTHLERGSKTTKNLHYDKLE